MKIARIRKIRNHWVFRDFTWPSGLPTFAQFNVIYGWNGSGKTALSVLFRHLQRKESISESEIEFELEDSTKISGANIPNANTPDVRVFNRDFVDETIQAIGDGNVSPVYVLGEKSIDKQKQAEELRSRLVVAQASLSNAVDDKNATKKNLDNFCIDRARIIKDALIGSQQYRNYDKRNFNKILLGLKNLPEKTRILSDQEKEKYQQQRRRTAKHPIPEISVQFSNIELLHSRVLELLHTSIVSKVMRELIDAPDIGAWVQHGLSLHRGNHETEICRFCGSRLPEQRLAEIEAHFNDDLRSLQQQINQTIGEIESHKNALVTLDLPGKSRFYDDLSEEYESAKQDVKQEISVTNQFLDHCQNALTKKMQNVFDAFVPDNLKSNIDLTVFKSSVSAANNVINKHGGITVNLKNEIKIAEQAIEKNYAAEALSRFERLGNEINVATVACSSTEKITIELKEQIRNIEREIVEHRLPAEELNGELAHYLGHRELEFEVKDTGYLLKRGEQLASHLSEGERTAIAFLYFLKVLKDRDFDFRNGIVVIDDPVSSLDAKSLFSAFGYMKERTKGCRQLFILTHNFSYFRQIKNWFHYLPGQKKTDLDKRPAHFYMLTTHFVNDERTARLSPMDPLLERFESEYHFLFKQVYEVATSDNQKSRMTQLYGMPNIARRLIEAFLSYKFPNYTGNLSGQLGDIEFDPARKNRILRLLTTYSHSSGISEPEHDLSMLGETPQLMEDVLTFIQKLDEEHYRRMIDLIESDSSEE